MREVAVPLSTPKDMKALIFWKVNNSRKYFLTIKKEKLEAKIAPTLTSSFHEIIENYNLNKILEISNMQKTSPGYTNSELEEILAYLNKSISGKGFIVIRIIFRYHVN